MFENFIPWKMGEQSMGYTPVEIKLDTLDGFENKAFADILNIQLYINILYDVFTRVEYEGKKETAFLFAQNPLETRLQRGIIHYLSRAVAHRSTGKLYYYKIGSDPLGVSNTELTDQELPKGAELKNFIEYNFKEHAESRLTRMYYMQFFDVITNMVVALKVGNTPVGKLELLTKGGSKDQEASIKRQAEGIAEGIKKRGKMVFIDGKSTIEIITTDLKGTKEAQKTMYGFLADTLKMPLSYFSGEASSVLGALNDQDLLRTEQGLRRQYINIFKPIIDTLLDVESTFLIDKPARLSSVKDNIKAITDIPDDVLSVEEKRTAVKALLKGIIE